MDNRFYKPTAAMPCRRHEPMRLAPIALAAAFLAPLLAPCEVAAQADDFAPLRLSRGLSPAPRGDAAKALPIVLRARELRGQGGLETVAEGDVEFRRGGAVIRADLLQYNHADDLAVARGRVRISRDGSVYRGPELQLHVQRFEGFFLKPEFDFARTAAGGSADRIDFIDSSRLRATNALYTSCPRDGSGDPAWLLTTRSVRFDTEANEGIAEGAVLRFMGVPILALPRLSFPISDARKSGWLPPSVNLDNRSGFELALPYYWNIAPQRDATITPKASTRRGFGVETEFRYLEPQFEGSLTLDLLPSDLVARRSRHALSLQHQGRLGSLGAAFDGARYALRGARVSDDDWWKDFPRSTSPTTLTPRLLPLVADLERPLAWGGAQGLLYARMQRWQVLQSSIAGELITPLPYERSPQLGLRGKFAHAGIEVELETEVNRFTVADGLASATRPSGWRAHMLAALSRPWRQPGWWVTPRLSFNAAAYDLDQNVFDLQRRRLQRVIPSASLDAGLEFERQTQAFGRTLRQTLEPRLLYVSTAYRRQSEYLAFDSAAKDFSFSSIFSENAFSGVDRVSDGSRLTAGVTSRLVDETSGAELLRLGLVQRYLFGDQRNTPLDAQTRRFSDLLLLGSTNVLPGWTLDASLQYNAEVNRPVRSILSARYSPGPYRTVGGTYRLARDASDPLGGIQSEQLELGWQWPVGRIVGAIEPGARESGRSAGTSASTSARGSACGGQLYGVGRINYSLRDSRITDSILGLEFDAGCWIGRVVAERLSTGRSEATTRLLLQLELVGLSRLGSNPLRVLKDNIPGYRLLRDDSDEPKRTSIYD